MNNYFSYLTYFKQFEPLSKRQVYRLLKSKDIPEVANKLALHHMRIVCSIVRRHYEKACFDTGIDPSELIDAGFLALRKVIKKYKPGKRWSIRYVKDYVRGTIKHEYKKLSKSTRSIYTSMRNNTKNKRNPYNDIIYPIQTISLNEVRYYDNNDEPLTWEETIPDIHEQEKLQREFLIEEVLSAIEKNLSPNEREIIEMKFGVGQYSGSKPLSYREMEKKLRMSRETIRLKIEEEILPKVREIFCNLKCK